MSVILIKEYKGVQHMENKRKLIIDCDPGVDDAIALAFLCANLEQFQLLAVTTVSGNQTIDKVTRNALDWLDFLDMDVPVSRGMEGPIIRKPVYAEDAHGDSGLGNISLPVCDKKPVDEQAVLYLKKVLEELPSDEKITFVCMGPLTNIAMLFKMFPHVKNKIREILFMGGAALGGNVTPSAEFNIYTDPEAAKIVTDSKVPLIMFGLDVTNKCCLTRKQILKLCQSPAPVARKCGDMAGFYLENTANKYRGVVSIHDVAPVMYLCHPEIFRGERAILNIDCSEGVSRGRTICDMRWWEHEPENMDTLIMMDVDQDKFQEYLILSLYELCEKQKNI